MGGGRSTCAARMPSRSSANFLPPVTQLRQKADQSASHSSLGVPAHRGVREEGGQTSVREPSGVRGGSYHPDLSASQRSLGVPAGAAARQRRVSTAEASVGLSDGGGAKTTQAPCSTVVGGRDARVRECG